jgi:hypothetical protein
MSKSFNLDTLTEGIRQRHLGTQNVKLVEKWSRTGLLRGMKGVHRENMARLLENQAGQVLKEASSLSTGGGNLTSSGDMRGFTNIAFPIVRRVFGGLIANELVSIQPMSLPSGLLFYLDYTYGTASGGDALTAGSAIYNTGSSIYNAPPGSGVRSGSQAVGGMYDLVGMGYSRVRKTSKDLSITLSGSIGSTGTSFRTEASVAEGTSNSLMATGSDAKLMQFDPQVTNAIETASGLLSDRGAGDGSFRAVVLSLSGTDFNNLDSSLAKTISLSVDATSRANGILGNDPNGKPFQDTTNVSNVLRLNQVGSVSGQVFTVNALEPQATRELLMIVTGTNLGSVLDLSNSLLNGTLNFPLDSSLSSDTGSTLVIPAFESNFASSPSPEIPEIDIKIEAIAVVANTRKLRAKWSPELAQDLNAYHSLDAEVELTQILSEQIALEIDREILNDLLTEGNAANYYWSRAPGKFVNKETGAEILAGSSLAPGPSFRGTVREWYETFIETIIDVGNQIHRKTLRGSANFIVVGPDVATILEASVFYKPSYTLDGEGQVSQPMVLGAEKTGTLSNRFTVYKDPYFPRNKVLVGYKGGSYLETGYVYAPYVPLIVTPTIFAPEDFTPRKGVMTRYGKKMVRSDFYGTVTCMDMSII